MATYNWQLPGWPDFKYDPEILEDTLITIAEKMGRVSGILQALPTDTGIEAIVDMMVAEAIKTSEIEGEFYSRQDVMSSIRNNLGLNAELVLVADKKAEGLGKLIVFVRNTFKDELNEAALFQWHGMLMQARKSVTAGAWREHRDPMQVISGSISNPTIHFEAPPSDRVPDEMARFVSWFNETGPGGTSEIAKAPVRAAIAHLYFESIHPFEDGNGRIGRAIAEKALSQGIGRPAMLSLSKTIEANKKQYYKALEFGQKSNEITDWIKYFVNTILTAQKDAETQITFTLQKVKFFDRYKERLNERQHEVISKMLSYGPEGFEGGINAKKYMSITKTSKATATRDLQELLSMGAFRLFGDRGGRSTKYQVNLPS